jgi:hypothetical protein
MRLTFAAWNFYDMLPMSPTRIIIAFFYSDRQSSSGSLCASQITKDSDICIIARATQLLDSNNPVPTSLPVLSWPRTYPGGLI